MQLVADLMTRGYQLHRELEIDCQAYRLPRQVLFSMFTVASDADVEMGCLLEQLLPCPLPA